MDFSGLAYDPLLDPTNASTDFTTTTTTTSTTTTNSASRKRSRSATTPNPSKNHKPPSPQSAHAPLSPSVSLVDRLKDPAQRNSALNELLQGSSTNFALDGDAVLQELAAIVFQILDWNPRKLQQEPTFIPWQFPNPATEAWAQHCQAAFSNKINVLESENLRSIETIVVILRNLSFAAANIRLLAFSPHILAILIGALYQQTFSTSPANLEDSSRGSNNTTDLLPISALHTLVNLSPHLDVTGQKLFCDKLFLTPKRTDTEGPILPHPSSFGLAVDAQWGFGSLWLAKRLDTKEDLIMDVPQTTLLEITHAADYLIQVWAIFPALDFLLNDPKAPRAVLLTAVDLLQEFVNQARATGSSYNTTNPARTILLQIPDSVLLRLTDLLYVPRLGPDGLSYEDPTINLVTRVNMFKLMTGYDSTVDTDVRDRALDILMVLLELDTSTLTASSSSNASIAFRMALDPGKTRIRTRFFDALVPILTGQAGRNDASLLASQLLKELAQVGGPIRMGLLYIQNRLLEWAARDQRISQLALAHLYHPARDHNNDANGVEEGEDETKGGDSAGNKEQTV